MSLREIARYTDVYEADLAAALPERAPPPEGQPGMWPPEIIP